MCHPDIDSQEAIRNHGRVDMMQKRNGEKIAVKRMPNRWVREGPIEFNEQCAGLMKI